MKRLALNAVKQAAEPCGATCALAEGPQPTLWFHSSATREAHQVAAAWLTAREP